MISSILQTSPFVEQATPSRPVRVALLNMYNRIPNQGMRCIRTLLDEQQAWLEWTEFDVRAEYALPDLSFDVYLCSGGPGNPLEGDGVWDVRFYALLDQLWAHNQDITQTRKKYGFFICHSFQMACQHFGLGEIARRRTTSFGVMPVHKTQAGKSEPVLSDLPDPFYAVESRDWQVIQPRLGVFAEKGAKIVALEKIRDHVADERAIMAVRFSPEFFGTQFHPEADADGMLVYFSQDDKREQVIELHGAEKYQQMIERLQDPDKIELTQKTIIPNFLLQVRDALQGTL